MYDKWSKYKIGRVKWINNRRSHAHRDVFIDTAQKYESIIEIGPGELIEYQELQKINPDIQYYIVDVSDLFIAHCTDKFPEVKIIRSAIEDLHQHPDERCDLVYVASVFEHSRDVKTAIKNAINLANRFHFVLFKWSYEGNLESRYNKKKKYWSSSFNIRQFMDVVSDHGTITSSSLVSPEGAVEDFGDIPTKGNHRDGRYLIIQGTRNRSDHG